MLISRTFSSVKLCHLQDKKTEKESKRKQGLFSWLIIRELKKIDGDARDNASLKMNLYFIFELYLRNRLNLIC